MPHECRSPGTTLTHRGKWRAGWIPAGFPLGLILVWCLALIGMSCLLPGLWYERKVNALGWIGPTLTCAGLLLALGLAAFGAAFARGWRLGRKSGEFEGQRWQLALEATHDGLWDWNPATRKTFYSPRWKALLGYAEEEIGTDVGEWWLRIHPEDQARVMEELEQHLRGESEYFSRQYRMRCKDGGYKWFFDRGRAIFAADGTPVRFAGSSTDITERRQFNAALFDLNEQLAAFFSLSPGGFLSFDGEGKVHMANPAFERMTGIKPEHIMFRSLEELDARIAGLVSEPALFRGIMAYVNDAGVPFDRKQLELDLPVHSVLDISGISVKSQSISRLLYLHDVTKEVALARMKTEFLSTAAHELRTPLSSIYGFSEYLLENECDGETRKDLLQTILRHSELMVRISNELLDLSRIDSRQGKDFVFARIDLAEVLRETLRDTFFDQHAWSLRLEISPDSCWIHADAVKIKQALANLFDNAKKYSPQGGSLELACCPQPQEGMARVSIRDHGIGIKPEQIGRVFERFYRVDNSGHIPGTGLGLSIVKEIVELHGGRIEITSQYGAGTEVCLWLPLIS